MKKLISILLISCTFAKAQTWQQLGDFPGIDRDDGASFVIGNKAYCGTGLAAGMGTSIDFYSLDLSSNTWTTISSMPAGKNRQYACAFSNGINGFVFGGESGGTDFNDLWMYSPSTNLWTAKPSKPGNGVRGAACFVIGNVAYIIGGAYSTTDALNEVWAYDMSSNTWTQKNNMPFNCWRSSATSSGGKGYLTFGRDVNGRFKKELYEYDLIADSWTLINNFPSAGRAYATMQNINNELVVFAGYDTLNNYYNDIWTYNITGANWTQKISLPSFGRKGGMAFTNNSILYYSTGINVTNTRLRETWMAAFPVGIEEYVKKENILIYPYPTRDLVNIKFPKSISQKLDYKIIDAKGSVVLSGIFNEIQQIEVSQLNPGIYQIIIGDYTSRVSIQ